MDEAQGLCAEGGHFARLRAPGARRRPRPQVAPLPAQVWAGDARGRFFCFLSAFFRSVFFLEGVFFV